jgi:hypothetical protein
VPKPVSLRAENAYPAAAVLGKVHSPVKPANHVVRPVEALQRSAPSVKNRAVHPNPHDFVAGVGDNPNRAVGLGKNRSGLPVQNLLAEPAWVIARSYVTNVVIGDGKKSAAVRNRLDAVCKNHPHFGIPAVGFDGGPPLTDGYVLKAGSVIGPSKPVEDDCLARPEGKRPFQRKYRLVERKPVERLNADAKFPGRVYRVDALAASYVTASSARLPDKKHGNNQEKRRDKEGFFQAVPPLTIRRCSLMVFSLGAISSAFFSQLFAAVGSLHL